MTGSTPDHSTHRIMRDVQTYLLASRYKTDEGHLKPSKKNMPYIFVTQECVDKAIDFANSFFHALEKKRFIVDLRECQGIWIRSGDFDIIEDDKKHRSYRNIWSPAKVTYAEIDDVPFGIAIYEMLSEENATYIDGTYYRDSDLTAALIKKMTRHHTWTTTRHFPTGRLCLLVYSYDGWMHKWKETTKAGLEKQIPQAIKFLKSSIPELLQAKERLRLEAEQRDREWEALKLKWAIEKEQKIVADATARSTAHINEIINTWDKATKLNGFFNAVEQQIMEANDSRKAQVLERIRLAKELIGTVDPMEHLANWKTPNEIAALMRGRDKDTD